MKKIAIALLAPALALPLVAAPSTGVSAQSVRAPRERSISIVMSDGGFLPRRFALRRDAPYVLFVTNRSGDGHNLTQKAFFRQARVADRDYPIVRDGRISLAPGESAAVHFLAPETRPGGTYQFTSDVLGDAGKDYTGVFVIR